MHLSESILAYYLDNLEALEGEKRFHLCTRLAAWRGESQALAYLRDVRPEFVPEPFDAAKITATLDELVNRPPTGQINALGLRQQYFERYPHLRGIDFAMFRVRHLEAVYGVDARAQLLRVVSTETLIELSNRLLADPEAIRVLSTYAINYLYLLQRVVLRDDSPMAIDVPALYELGDAYDIANPEHIQLLIYLYTHCIIGETNFYVRQIPAAYIPAYTRMLERLERLIDEQFENINLDNKLEFLVCCRITGYRSTLFDRIYDECERSVSDEGTFLVDRHNANAQSEKTTFSASEHRNVLFIMSTTPYIPHATTV
jgi:hypothetical protein